MLVKYPVQSWHSWISNNCCFSHQEDNGTQEALITKDHISSSTPFKDRVKLDVDGRLHLSPVHIHDDGKKFSCRLTVRTDKILRSSTTVKVFGKGFCSMDSLTYSCQCLLLWSSLKRKPLTMLASTHTRVTVLDFHLPWSLSLLLGVGTRVED